MKTPMTITFRGMAPSEWMEADIRARAAKLETYCRRITKCHVSVDIPHRHHEDGNRISVRIDLTVPGEELAVTHKSRKDIRVVIGKAFDIARRQLREYTSRRRAPRRLKVA
jgi:ribosome-associated translation inhibitor RaiA